MFLINVNFLLQKLVTFYLVVLVGSFCLDVQVHACTVREAFEEVQEHFRGHLPHLFPLELGIPHKPRASAKVQAYLAQAIVHGQAVSISFYATLVTKGLGKALAQGKGSVFYGMVFVYDNRTIAHAANSGHRTDTSPRYTEG